ncbi:MAG: type IV pilin N-terminal domain-containing protein [Thermoplasmatales archaeon]|nr:type IV pilin N-terminal domain-containing protein [Thermoplasmatales archaeon]
MKTMKKDAVSPVIGVILMLTITVILAAVFYLWVIGFIGGGVKETPTVKLIQAKSGNQYNITVTQVSRICSVDDVNFFVLNKEGEAVRSGYVSDIYGYAEGNVSFMDVNKDEKLSVNDYFIIKGEYATSEYTFRLTYSLTGNIMGEIKLS